MVATSNSSEFRNAGHEEEVASSSNIVARIAVRVVMYNPAMGYIASKSGKDGKPRYYAVYKDRAGKRRWEAAGRYKKDAESLLKRRESEVLTGVKPDDITFSIGRAHV